MSQLKNENFKKCLSVLSEFINDPFSPDSKKRAVLALSQLERITAGAAGDSSACIARPRLDGGS